MITKNLVNIAYEIAKKDFKNSEFDFNDLVEKVITKAEISEEVFNNQIGDFYTNLLQDVRFVFSGNNKWTLKENLTVSEYQIKMNSLYDFEQNELVEDYEHNLNEVNNEEKYKNDDADILDDDIEFEYDHEDEETDDENFTTSLEDEETDDINSDIDVEEEF